MRSLSLFFSLFLMASAGVWAGESHYEVYYFYASWRCANCTNAEAWAGEAVATLQQSNPNVKIVYAPKQLEKNRALVAQSKAKRVDLVVAEVKDGKMIRFENLGNLLEVIGSKPALMKKCIDGIARFASQSAGTGTLNLTDSYAALEQKANAPVRKIGVYIILNNAANQGNLRAADIISQTLTNSFDQQLQSQSIMASLIDAGQEQNQGWLDLFKAGPGDVVVALISGTNIENFSTIKQPQNQDQEQTFVSSFTNAMRQSITMGDL